MGERIDGVRIQFTVTVEAWVPEHMNLLTGDPADDDTPVTMDAAIDAVGDLLDDGVGILDDLRIAHTLRATVHGGGREWSGD